MRRNKFFQVIGLLFLVVLVTVATNYVINKNNTEQSQRGFSFDQVPASYANFKNASRAGDTDFTVAAELTVNAVVHVKVKSEVMQSRGFGEDPFFEYFFGPQFRQQQPQIREGAGSGVIISSDGYIVTNNHVIDNSKEIEVVLNDKRTFTAKVVGSDPNTDIALLKIEEKELPFIIFGNSDSLKVGEWVLAVGNPFNLTSTVTAGIVSAKARNINILNAAMKIESFIQTDAAVNPGNSGGALVNTRGELVGINTAIASQTGSYAGYSFAVPSSIVQKVVSDIRQYGVVQRAVLGVEIKDIDGELAKEKKLNTFEGAYVANVVENSAAEKAGVKSGDVITNVNGVDVKSVAQLQEQVGRYRPGDKITIDILRDNKKQKLKVELKNRQGNTDLVSSDVNVDLLGATFKEVDNKIKEKFGVDYGVEVKSISKGKFNDAGIKSGYIILKINNIKMSNERDIEMAMKTVLDNADQNKVLWITGFYPNGKTAYYAVDLNS
ncbi:MAG: Do family serine endopeptidase [Paludibacter sp.]|nr:Do family serine endopeptidase [Paludibacter sp.]MDD4198863.1 Do family serine endopeptidase [Paludibacter sp.]MDD4427481.1 Do family serine endopeptidase [Paludibacter sp.]